MTELERILSHVKETSYEMTRLTSDLKNTLLLDFAKALEASSTFLLTENEKDLKLQPGKISKALFQRLKLDASKLIQIVDGVREVSRLADPVGWVLEETVLDKGLVLTKKSVPLGVIAIIFESRPDVIPQVLSLALKSGNAVVLKGGSEALHSNRAFMKVLQECIGERLSRDWAVLLETREEIQKVLAYPQFVDLVIPRGSNQLVQMVMNSTRIPVLGHADGVCHIFADESLSEQKEQTSAIDLILDSKTNYPSACNAVETTLIHETVSESLLPRLMSACEAAGVAIKGCEKTRKILPLIALATESDYFKEYGDLTMNLKVVSSLEEAISHVHHFGSHHTDCILSVNPIAIERFLTEVDSANVFANASTRFADGYRYGFGAEVGISTSKTHARGPVGLEGLVIYKYQLRGEGHRVADYVGPQAKPFLHKRRSGLT